MNGVFHGVIMPTGPMGSCGGIDVGGVAGRDLGQDGVVHRADRLEGPA
jgi:hypothetical protein